MQILDAIHSRRSVPQLDGPAPVDRAGDHHHVSATVEHDAVGAAAQNLLPVAHDAGLGATTRTGVHVTAAAVRASLAVETGETIARFIHLGVVPPDGPPDAPDRASVSDITAWRGR